MADEPMPGNPDTDPAGTPVKNVASAVSRATGPAESLRPKWRAAVKRAMRQAALRQSQVRYGTKTPRFNYRWEHVRAVVRVSRRLAALVDADADIVEAAAWLHDIAKDHGAAHAELGAAFAYNFLPQTDFPSEKIDRVASAIADHIGLWLDEPLSDLESQVLWDADKLTKLGLTAAMQWTGNFIALKKDVSSDDMLENGRRHSWQHKTVASMHTAPAKRAARTRMARFNALWDDLERELAGNDLEIAEDDLPR